MIRWCTKTSFQSLDAIIDCQNNNKPFFLKSAFVDKKIHKLISQFGINGEVGSIRLWLLLSSLRRYVQHCINQASLQRVQLMICFVACLDISCPTTKGFKLSMDKQLSRHTVKAAFSPKNERKKEIRYRDKERKCEISPLHKAATKVDQYLAEVWGCHMLLVVENRLRAHVYYLPTCDKKTALLILYHSKHPVKMKHLIICLWSQLRDEGLHSFIRRCLLQYNRSLHASTRNCGQVFIQSYCWLKVSLVPFEGPGKTDTYDKRRMQMDYHCQFQKPTYQYRWYNGPSQIRIF